MTFASIAALRAGAGVTPARNAHFVRGKETVSEPHMEENGVKATHYIIIPGLLPHPFYAGRDGMVSAGNGACH